MAKKKSQVSVSKEFLLRVISTCAADILRTSKPNQRSRINDTFIYDGEVRVCVGHTDVDGGVGMARTMRVVEEGEYERHTFDYDFREDDDCLEGLLVTLKGAVRVLTSELDFIGDRNVSLSSGVEVSDPGGVSEEEDTSVVSVKGKKEVPTQSQEKAEGSGPAKPQAKPDPKPRPSLKGQVQIDPNKAQPILDVSLDQFL